MGQSKIPSTATQRTMRSALAVFGLISCLVGISVAARDGLSRLAAETAKTESLLAAADEAIRLSPSDPDAHYARAYVLSSMGRFADGADEYEGTVALRQGDYLLWSVLGEARVRSGDKEGAMTAFKEAIRLAPYYAQAHWELGKLLLDSGQRDEAFAELRRGGSSRPSLLPDLINLAWETYSGDARAVEQAVKPETGKARVTLAKFFVDRGNAAEAVALVRAASDASRSDRQTVIARLLAKRRFAEAYELWSTGRDSSTVALPSDGGTIVDGGFEDNIAVNDQGFGWQPARNNDVLRLSLDAVEPRSGAYSLRLEFNGDSQASPLISQLALVEPKARYQLTFGVRTQEVVTGGLPVVTLTDASSADGRMLGQSPLLPQGTSAWQDYTVEFATSDETYAITVTVRQKCSSPCPIFGNVWLDDFSLRKVAGPGA